MRRSILVLTGVFLAGCSSDNQGTGTPSDMAVQADLALPVQPDLALQPTPSVSFLSPGGSRTSLKVPRQTTFTMGTEQAATIYYTLDGSQPRLGAAATRSGPSPLSVQVGPADATLTWFAEYGAPNQQESTRAIAVPIDTNTTQANFGTLAENVTFAKSGGPVVRAAPGELISGTLQYQAWRSVPTGYCPGCILQFVVLISTPAGDVVVNNGCDGNVATYGVYPGKANIAMNFSFTAPNEPGGYLLKYGMTARFSCDGMTPQAPIEAGLIIVQ